MIFFGHVFNMSNCPKHSQIFSNKNILFFSKRLLCFTLTQLTQYLQKYFACWNYKKFRIFCLVFWSPATNFQPLIKGQLHSPNVNQKRKSIFDTKVHQNLKTGYGSSPFPIKMFIDRFNTAETVALWQYIDFGNYFKFIHAVLLNYGFQNLGLQNLGLQF